MLAQQHLRAVFDAVARQAHPCWPSAFDTRSGERPTQPARLPRVYRSIAAPGGSTPYWDLPALQACRVLSRLTGDPRPAEHARAYLRHVLRVATASNGMLLWGNHYFLDGDGHTVMRFLDHEAPKPIDPKTERGELHELRPLPVPWDLLWDADAARCEAAIRVAVAGHLVEGETGSFNRHADHQPGFPFQEAGGVLAQTLSWLARKTGEPQNLRVADGVIDYVWSSRHPDTGLMPVQRRVDRWDRVTATSETGFWCDRVLDAAALAPEPWRSRWRTIAAEAMNAWLLAAYRPRDGGFWGRLDIRTARPDTAARTTPYQPGRDCDPLETLFPTHDYPVPAAQACRRLAALTGKPIFQRASAAWAELIFRQFTRGRGRATACADHYGRAITYLQRLGQLDRARLLLDQAIQALRDPATGLLSGQPGQHRVDAVDGVGLLLLAMIQAPPHPGQRGQAARHDRSSR